MADPYCTHQILPIGDGPLMDKYSAYERIFALTYLYLQCFNSTSYVLSLPSPYPQPIWVKEI